MAMGLYALFGLALLFFVLVAMLLPVDRGDFVRSSNASYRGPTSVDVFDFRANGLKKGKKVRVEWQTAQEVGILGFHLYRQVDGKAVRATKTMIGAKSLEPAPTVGGGHRYEYIDTPSNRHSMYILEVVGLDNNARRYGPIPITDP
jgi:hypothetical protein